MQRAADNNNWNNSRDWHGMSAERLTNHGKVYIRDLSCTTTPNDLKQYFQRFGVVEEVSIQRSRINQFYCFGFLTFAEAFMAENSILDNPHFIDGRWVHVRRVLNRQLIAPHNPATRKILIEGITADITENDLNEHFGYFGIVLEVFIPNNFVLGQVPGYCFIHFAENDAAERVCIQRYHYVNGQCLVAHKIMICRHSRRRYANRFSMLIHILRDVNVTSNRSVGNNGIQLGQGYQQNNGGGAMRLGDAEHNANIIMPYVPRHDDGNEP